MKDKFAKSEMNNAKTGRGGPLSDYSIDTTEMLDSSSSSVDSDASTNQLIHFDNDDNIFNNRYNIDISVDLGIK